MHFKTTSGRLAPSGLMLRPFRALALFSLLAFQPAVVKAEDVSAVTPPDASGVEFFEKKIRPILADHCYICHSAETKPAGGLRVDDRNGLLTGGDTGPAVVPGDPENSLLLNRVLHKNPNRRMPKEGEPLTEGQIADLTAWIQAGAAWPPERVPSSLGKENPEYAELRAKHWAWQPLTDPAAPEVKDASWPLEETDRFILAKLEEKGLPPVAEASPETLIRRLSFDLTGLPPTPEEVAAFVSDPSPENYEKTVDRLLASPRFGERWGRHWLDVARYGESTGPSRNIPYPHAWRYRDYVLDAVNRDIPFDRFIQEQIAGDLLPAENGPERDRLLTATGFLALGVKDVNQRFKVRFIMDNVDEKIDTVTRSVLGLTVSCARCHDHKFDPVPMTDYYALAGIFTSTDDCAGVRNKMGGGGLDYYDPRMLLPLSVEPPPVPEEKLAKLKAEVAEAKKAWDAIRGTPEGLKRGPNGQPVQRPYRLKYERLQAELLALTDPAARGYAIHGVRDAKTVGDTEIRLRGEAERLGPKVPRGFLTAFNVPGAPAVNPEASGRLELARWLTSPENPLTPRVIVNRIWKHLFGQGIVTTVDNFGVTGDTPSHPELLDYLARRFIGEGWSVKKLVRTLALSRAYRLGAETTPAHLEADPANRFVWRHSPRRLDAEELRDAMLFSAGELDLTPPEASPAKELKMIEMRDNGVEARAIHEKADRAKVRGVYLPLLRGVTPKALEAFDPVSQTLVTGQRDATTVPGQALFLLNSAFVRKQALTLAAKVAADETRFDTELVKEVYLRVLNREPRGEELLRALEFLAGFAASWHDAGPALPVLAENAVPPPPAPDDAATAAVADNPDDIDRTPRVAGEEAVVPSNAKEAAWMHFIQALYASAEFRFAR